MELRRRAIELVAAWCVLTSLHFAGSPGIGNTYFLLYFLYKIVTMQSQPPVIILHRYQGATLCFKDGEVLVGSLADFEPYLYDEETWYVPFMHFSKTLSKTFFVVLTAFETRAAG